MKITIEKGEFSLAVVTCNDGLKIPCINEKEVLREVKAFLSELKFLREARRK